MELYEYARPALMAGKKILYVHGFASSGQNGSVKTLRLLMPQAEVSLRICRLNHPKRCRF